MHFDEKIEVMQHAANSVFVPQGTVPSGRRSLMVHPSDQ